MADDETIETTDSTNGTETADTETAGADTEENLSGDEPIVDVAKLQEQNKKLFERAKKAETEVKTLKGATKPKVEASPAPSQASVEETVLLANGMPEELLAQLKKVAQVQGTSLLKAQNDSIFVAIKDKFEKDKKQADASLRASRGSGALKVEKKINTPGLSRDEHRQMAAEFNG